MKLQKENGRTMVEYDDGSRKFYTDGERFVEDDLPEVLDNVPEKAKKKMEKAKKKMEKAGAFEAFKQLPESDQKKYMKEKLKKRGIDVK